MNEIRQTLRDGCRRAEAVTFSKRERERKKGKRESSKTASIQCPSPYSSSNTHSNHFPSSSPSTQHVSLRLSILSLSLSPQTYLRSDEVEAVLTSVLLRIRLEVTRRKHDRRLLIIRHHCFEVNLKERERGEKERESVGRNCKNERERVLLMMFTEIYVYERECVCVS